MVEILLSAMNKMSGKVLKNMFQKKPADIFWGYVELLSMCFPPLLNLTVFLLRNAVTKLDSHCQSLSSSPCASVIPNHLPLSGVCRTVKCVENVGFLSWHFAPLQDASSH